MLNFYTLPDKSFILSSSELSLVETEDTPLEITPMRLPRILCIDSEDYLINLLIEVTVPSQDACSSLPSDLGVIANMNLLALTLSSSDGVTAMA